MQSRAPGASPARAAGDARAAGATAALDARDRRSRWSRSAPYAFVALVALAVYANTLGNGFVYDDHIILHSPLLGKPWSFAAIFDNQFRPASAGRIANYRPLNDWSHLLNYSLSRWITGAGASGACFHLVNALLHAAVACLALAWFAELGLGRRVALTGALLFAVLPIHTEAVANITGRSEMEAAMFGLVFLILHRRRARAWAAIAYALALLCKESAIAFLPLAVAMDVCLPREEARRARDVPEHVAGARRLPLWSYGALAVIALAWLLLRAYAVQSADQLPTIVQNPLRFVPLGERLLTAARVQLDYLRLELFPIQLSSDYSMNQIPVVTSALDPRFLVFSAVLAAAIAGAWHLRRRAPIVAFAVLGYAILFSTTSNFLVPIGTIMGERLAYAPSLMVSLLLASALWQAERWIGARGVIAAVALLALAYAGKTFAQNRVWHDELTLFAEQARTAPDSAKAHAQYGNALVEAGRDREAIAQYERSIAIRAYKPEVFYQMGCALNRVHADPEQSIAAFRGAIERLPNHLDARAALALTLIAVRRWDEARAEVREIAARDPGHSSLDVLDRLLAAAPR
jgi:tetratricopeptide (TPR) repeat protein